MKHIVCLFCAFGLLAADVGAVSAAAVNTSRSNISRPGAAINTTRSNIKRPQSRIPAHKQNQLAK